MVDDVADKVLTVDVAHDVPVERARLLKVHCRIKFSYITFLDEDVGD